VPKIVENAFIPTINSDITKRVMELVIDDRLKILLLLGIGSFENQGNTEYTEIVKEMASQKRLFMIIASSDYIYGTNYQFCHELIGKDLTNMSQQKTIQALGRVGRNNVIFKMPKFRSMRVGTPAVATHLLADASSHLTAIGSFLRKSSLDELPQLWSILAGDMSFVGPRPALFNQQELIALRTEQGVHTFVPGLTGWAQVNGRDEIPISQKVQLDAEYLHRQSFFFDIKILWMTALKVFNRDGVSH
jgi:O-antigen biosynthesis protein WbqP